MAELPQWLASGTIIFRSWRRTRMDRLPPSVPAKMARCRHEMIRFPGISKRWNQFYERSLANGRVGKIWKNVYKLIVSPSEPSNTYTTCRSKPLRGHATSGFWGKLGEHQPPIWKHEIGALQFLEPFTRQQLWIPAVCGCRSPKLVIRCLIWLLSDISFPRMYGCGSKSCTSMVGS